MDKQETWKKKTLHKSEMIHSQFRAELECLWAHWSVGFWSVSLRDISCLLDSLCLYCIPHSLMMCGLKFLVGGGLLLLEAPLLFPTLFFSFTNCLPFCALRFRRLSVRISRKLQDERQQDGRMTLREQKRKWVQNRGKNKELKSTGDCGLRNEKRKSG